MKLAVWYRQQRIGTLSAILNDRIGFEYDREWVESPGAFPVSWSLPLTGEYERGTYDHRFFANLLPEAAARETICRGLGISRDNDFELLAAIGGECAGALQITPEDDGPATNSGYSPITESQLTKAIESNVPYSRFNTGGALRLSLAGAQDKWPVYFDGDQLFWPNGSAPSSHILKFSNRSFKGLNWNEAYISFIASELGLPAVRVAVGNGYSLSRRYDRQSTEDGTILRIHQEDFCQALGFPYYNKYENDRGPSFNACCNLIRNISVTPAQDLISLLRWQELNLLLGNADGHAKNLSILYRPEGPVLAPFYDLVCTAVYPEISRDLAFSVGGISDPGQIRTADWEKLASELGMRSRIILNSLTEFIEELSDNLADYHERFVQLNGSDPVLDRIDQAIRKRLRRTRTLLME